MEGGGGDVLLLDDRTTTKGSISGVLPAPRDWPATPNINLHLHEDQFLSCPKVMSFHNQTTVNMMLVVINDTKLVVIKTRAFTPPSDALRGERTLNKERIISYSSNATQV